MRPGKFRLVVETQTSLLLSRPNVSDGPPRHAAHEAPCAILAPALWKVSSRVSPFSLVVATPRPTSVVAGTVYVSVFTWRPLRIGADATESVSFATRAAA